MSKSEHYQRIVDFMELAGQEIPTTPVLPSLEVRKLRAKLILEEVIETIEALGFGLPVTGDQLLDESIQLEPDLVEIADGCADISVVTVGTLIACGIHDNELFEEVDNNNLKKFGPGGYRNEAGKWVKPPDHKKPDIEGVIQRQIS